MKKVAVANMKGGVGKSTSTMMIADALSLHHGKRVLIIDCDPQSNVSQMILSFPGLENARAANATLTHWVESFGAGAIVGSHQPEILDVSSTISWGVSGLAELKANAKHPPKSKGQVSIWPATPDLRFAELAFDHLFFEAGDLASPTRAMTNYLSGALKEIESNYDVVIFDCPPGFSTLAQAALVLSDIILSPLNVDRVSLWSLKSFWQKGLSETLDLNNPESWYAFLTMVQTRRGAEQERVSVRRDLSNFAKSNKLDLEMPYSVQALRFVRRPALNSFERFNKKYGPVKDHVRRLGDIVVRILEGVET